MNKRQATLLALRVGIDLFAITFVWVSVYFLRFYTIFENPKGIPEFTVYLKLVPFIIVIWAMVFTAAGFYKRTGAHRTAFLEGLDIIQSCVLATFAFISVTYFYDEYKFSRGVLILFALIHPLVIMTGRSIVRKALRHYRRNNTHKSILLVGSGESFRHTFEVVYYSGFEAARILGAVLIGNDAEIEAAKKLCLEKNIDILENPDDWTQFLAQKEIRSAVFALPYSSYGFLDKNLEVIADQVMDIKMIPDLMRYTRFVSGIEMVGQTPVISVHESPLAGLGSLSKRAMDLFGSVVALTLFGPIMAFSALLVKLTSAGPIFYYQERTGIDGKAFKMIKFRSMPLNSEKATGAVWSKPGETRATPVGAFLRKTSLDELPQLFNVLRGDMSLVGPRPERPVFVDDFRKEIPGYMLRHKVKAGITGWAQVNGWRGDTSLEKRIECDLYYIQNWSLWFDIRIILLTFIKGFINKNAY